MKHLRPYQKRAIIFILLLFIISVTSLFAGAVGQIIGGVVTMVGSIIAAPFTAGASLVGVAAGAALVASGGSQLAAQDKEELEEQQQYMESYQSANNNYLNAQMQVTELEANIAQIETDILQTEANISSYDQTLVRWQSQYDQDLLDLKLQGESSYNELMQNWQGAELLNATRGQTGGSAALVAESQAKQIELLAGKDMMLDSEGGIYGTALNEFRLDALAGRTELVGNLNIQKQALSSYQSTLSSYQSLLATAKNNLSSAEALRDTAKQNAINNGVGESYLG